MAGTRPIVLIHSGDDAVAQALRFVLTLDNVEVHLCPDEAAMLDSPVLKRGHCLVLQDDPPHVDGCGLLRAARRKGSLAPAIMLVSALNAATWTRAEAAGAWLVLERPILDSRLVDAILSRLPGREEPLRIIT